MIGFWLGDNFGNREGTVIRKGKRSSGRFGVVSNDKEVIQRFLAGMKSEFGITKIKIDIQIPQNVEADKEQLKKETAEKFGIPLSDINAYRGSPWRRKIGYTVYTNDTQLLRLINQEIYTKLPELISSEKIDISELLKGLSDAEGDVDKANKLVKITNKNPYIIQIIETCLGKLNLEYNKRTDNVGRTRIEMKSIIEFKQKIGFSIKRKQEDLEEMISGNFIREKDKIYLKEFESLLKEGATAKEISIKLNIPHPTVKLVLRNLASSNLVKREKNGLKYIYSLPTS
jgi:hypothetical protein